MAGNGEGRNVQKFWLVKFRDEFDLQELVELCAAASLRCPMAGDVASNWAVRSKPFAPKDLASLADIQVRCKEWLRQMGYL